MATIFWMRSHTFFVSTTSLQAIAFLTKMFRGNANQLNAVDVSTMQLDVLKCYAA